MADSTTNDSTMVTLGKFKVGGYVYWAPLGTALPTDSSTPLPAAWKLLGYISEDGVTITTDTDTTEVKDANGTTVMKVISSFAESCQFSLLEVLRVEAAKLRYNETAVTGTDKSMTIKHQMPSDTGFCLVFELVMTGDVKDRLVIGVGTRAEFGERQVHAGDAQLYDVTVSMNDMDGTGVTAIEYIGIAPAAGKSAAAALEAPDAHADETTAELPDEHPTIQVDDATPETEPAETTADAAEPDAEPVS